MALANLTSRKLKILVGTDSQDWSLSYGEFVPGQSSWDESGLIRITASLSVLQTLAAPESINPRTNPARWRPGQPVTIKLWDSGGWVDHPLGKLIITEEPDLPQDGKTTLKLGCWLAWADTLDELADDQSGVTLGTAENCAAIAERLLIAAGIPAENIDLGEWPYELAYPVAKTTGGSFAGQAGELAYSCKRYLYQDASGIVRAGVIGTTPGTPAITITLGQNDALFEAQKDPQSPVELVKVAGIGYVVDPLDNGRSTTNVTTGNISDYVQGASGVGTIRSETVTETYDIPDPPGDITYTTVTEISELEAVVWVEPNIPTQLQPWKRITDVKRYYQGGANDGRLKSVTTTTEQRQGSLSADGVASNWRTVSEQTTTYLYSSDETVSQLETTERVAEITVDKESDSPFQLQIARKEITTWQEVAPSLWRKKVQTETARIVEDSGVDKFATKPWGRRTTSDTQLSGTGDTQPPRTELWEGVTQSEVHYEGTASWEHPGGSTGRTRNRLFTVPFGFSDAQCAELAAIHRDMLAGRHYGAAIELPIVPELLTLGPLFQLAVVDGGLTYLYLADALSWGHVENRASAVCQGIQIYPYPGKIQAQALFTAPAAQFSAIGIEDQSAQAVFTAPAAQFSAVGVVRQVAQATFTAPPAQFSATGRERNRAQATFTAPPAQFSATITTPSDWVVSGGAWDDSGEWDDSAVWED